MANIAITPKKRRAKVARDQYGFPLDAVLIGRPFVQKPMKPAAKNPFLKAVGAAGATP